MRHGEFDVAIDALWQLGALAISEAERDGELTLHAGFANDAYCHAAHRVLSPRFAVAFREADGRELDMWRAHAVPVRAGRRVVVCPAWVAFDPEPDDAVVVVDPARSFGLAHPSTLGALAALETVVAEGTIVLDVGSGSGVLAVGAARLGAQRVDAVDIDEEARRVTTENTARNGVADIAAVRGCSLDDVDGPYDVVVANLLLPIIESLGAGLLGRVAPGGHLVLAGLLVGQDERAMAAVPPAHIVARIVVDGWVSVVARRPSTA
jgi:ribosomal protein L11 methyltransferase